MSVLESIKKLILECKTEDEFNSITKMVSDQKNAVKAAAKENELKEKRKMFQIDDPVSFTVSGKEYKGIVFGVLKTGLDIQYKITSKNKKGVETEKNKRTTASFTGKKIIYPKK